MVQILEFISEYYESYFRGLKVLNLQFNPDTMSSNHMSMETDMSRKETEKIVAESKSVE